MCSLTLVPSHKLLCQSVLQLWEAIRILTLMVQLWIHAGRVLAGWACSVSAAGAGIQMLWYNPRQAVSRCL